MLFCTDYFCSSLGNISTFNAKGRNYEGIVGFQQRSLYVWRDLGEVGIKTAEIRAVGRGFWWCSSFLCLVVRVGPLGRASRLQRMFPEGCDWKRGLLNTTSTWGSASGDQHLSYETGGNNYGSHVHVTKGICRCHLSLLTAECGQKTWPSTCPLSKCAWGFNDLKSLRFGSCIKP